MGKTIRHNKKGSKFRWSNTETSYTTLISRGLPLWLSRKLIHLQYGDLGLIPGLGRFPGEGKGYPLPYSDLENSMDCIVHGVTKSWTRLRDLKKKQKNIHGLNLSFSSKGSWHRGNFYLSHDKCLSLFWNFTSLSMSQWEHNNFSVCDFQTKVVWLMLLFRGLDSITQHPVHCSFPLITSTIESVQGNAFSSRS